ncbi:type 1 glutamine amidotransferase family protein [Oxalobacter paraformigenes]|uniref:hypothetical protein n=1 Tax=Oxalobacter paraformigenes TaxID=556268 RepID=UPI0011C704E8|nr:hypothetical protein [Oxalobacter paraformigenes]
MKTAIHEWTGVAACSTKPGCCFRRTTDFDRIASEDENAPVLPETRSPGYFCLKSRFPGLVPEGFRTTHPPRFAGVRGFCAQTVR